MKAFTMFMAMTAATGHSAAVAAETLAATPGLSSDLEQVVYGELWERSKLSKRDRSLVTVSAVVSQGHQSALAHQFNLALDHGVNPQELSGLITQVAYYAGVSVAVDASITLSQVFDARSIDLATLESGQRTETASTEALENLRNIVNDMVGDVSPGLAHFSNTALNGDLWLRSDLTPRDRSLITISSLISLGNIGQLSAHVPKGLGNGLAMSEIGEMVAQLAFYAGWPKAFSAAMAIKAMELPNQ